MEIYVHKCESTINAFDINKSTDVQLVGSVLGISNHVVR